jgi:hypothetical protein
MGLSLATRRSGQAPGGGLRELLKEAKDLRLCWALGNETLYKHRSLSPGARDHTLDVIKNSRVYFPSPKTFNDPFDCASPISLGGDLTDPQFFEELRHDEERMAREAGYTAEQLEALRADEGVPIERLAEAVRENLLRELRNDARVFCLTTQHNHPLMWSHYAASHTGVCLHFHCRAGNLFGLAREVLYMKERKPILVPLERQSADEITERLVFEKADFWGYEGEYRIIAHKTSDWKHRFDEHDRVRFNPEDLSGVTLGMRISDPDREELLALAQEHSPPLPVWQAAESPARFWMKLVRIQ